MNMNTAMWWWWWDGEGGTCAYMSCEDLLLIDQWIVMNIGRRGWIWIWRWIWKWDVLLFVTHHKVANDYGGKEKRHADFWGDPPAHKSILCKDFYLFKILCKSLNCIVQKDPHAIPHRLNPLPTEDTEHDHEAVHEVGEVPARHHLLREPLHIVWNTFELSPDFPPGRESPLCDQKFIHSQPV